MVKIILHFSFQIFFLLLVAIPTDLFAEEPLVSPGHLQFIENKNQWNSNIQFKAHLRGGEVYLEDNGFTFNFYDREKFRELHEAENHDKLNDIETDKTINAHAYKTIFIGARKAQIIANDPESYHHNYFIGNDKEKWASEVNLYKNVFYQGIYNGISLKAYSSGQNFKYDFIIAPGAEPADIQIKYEGIDLEIIDNDLILATLFTNILEEKPYAYQVIDGEIIEVACEYKLQDRTVSFIFPEGYNKKYKLVIDPVIVAATYIGSPVETYAHTATYDDAGNIFIGSICWYQGYPTTTGAYQINFTGIGGSNYDMAFTKFNPDGTSVLYATYIGGAQNKENPHSMIVNSNNDLVIFGTTISSDYPVTSIAYDQTHNGLTDLVVTVLSSTGSSLLGSTFIGGSADDGLIPNPAIPDNQYKGEVLVDANDNIYVGTTSNSQNFPTTAGAFQTTSGGIDGVLFKLNSNVSNLMWSTKLGGTSDDMIYSIRIDNNQNVYACGTTIGFNFPTVPGGLNPTHMGGADGFVVRINSTGSAMLNSTFIGTTSIGTGAYDQAYFIDLDQNGNVYVVGHSHGNIPITPGAYSNSNAFQYLQKLDPALSTLLVSTRIGSANTLNKIDWYFSAFAVDDCGNIYIGGFEEDQNIPQLPTTSNAFMATPDPNSSFFYTMVLAPDATSILYGSYFGAINDETHVDGGTSRYSKDGTIYQAICTNLNTMPTNTNAHAPTKTGTHYDAFALKWDFQQAGVTAAMIPSDTVGCVPLIVSFTNNSTTGATQYFWDFGDGSTDTAAAPSHNYTSVGTFQVMLIASDTGSCNGADTAFATINVDSSGLSAGFTYTVNGICDSFTVQFTDTSSGAVSYYWDFGDGTTDTASNPSHLYISGGNYTVTQIVQDPSGCVPADTAVANISLAGYVISIDSLPDRSGCAPYTANFNPTVTGGVSYFWDFGDGNTSNAWNPTHIYNNAGSYQVMFIISDSTSCNIADTAFATVTVNSDTVTAGINIITFDHCDSLIADLTYSGINAQQFFWDLGDGTTSTDQDPKHKYTVPGIYTITLIATDSSACIPADTATVQVELLPEVIALFTVPDACLGDPVLFQNNSVNGTTYSWDLGDGNLSAATDPQHTYTYSGQFTISLIASNPATCNLSDTFSTIVTISDSPVADFDLVPQDSVSIGTELLITDKSTGAATYFWRFGDGSTSILKEPKNTYMIPGTYEICQEVRSSAGCTDTLCKSILVVHIDEGELHTANAFSPNGDGFNDRYFISFANIAEMRLMIFNRWGEKVFETTDPTEGWDGNYKGIPQELGVYMFHITGSFNDGRPFEAKGNITLIR